MERLLVAPTTPDGRIAEVARAQHGVVSFRQLIDAGLSASGVDSRVRAGRLHRLHRGVFAVGHTRLTFQGRCFAALFALGPGAALSHVTAAALHALRPSASATIHVTVPTPGGRLRRAGIVVRRSTTLRPGDVTEVDAIAVTSVARTLLDCAAILAPGPLERCVERSLALRVFDLSAVHSAIAANRHRPGATTLARIITTIHDDPHLSRSELESRMRDICDAHGIRRPEVNVHVEGLEVDFYWRAERLIVETDGHETHGTRTAFEHDRARDARLTTRGYRVVRFTHRQLVHDPDHVAGTLVSLIDSVHAPRRR